MAMLHLITCGDNVKIWDSNGYTLLHQFEPSNTSDDVVTDVSWSRDGGMVASVTSRQSLLVVTGITPQGTRQLTSAAELSKPTCCRFCASNSRYICVGSHSGSVHLWDTKNGKLAKQYQGHKAPVTRVCFSASDRHVASASRAGQVLMHNVTSGVVTELPTSRSEPQCTRDLRYSATRAAVLGAAFDTGHVSLWDVNQRRLLHTFVSGHVAPAAALAFSPVNDILLASVGLDKRLVCYDPKSRSVIQTIQCDAPLTSVDFHGDGVQVVVGTSQGRVCVYDLRTPARPSRTFTAHRSSVQRVQFQPPVRGRSRQQGEQSTSTQESHSMTAARVHTPTEETDPRSAAGAASGHTHSTPNSEPVPSPAPIDASDVMARATPGQASADQSSVFSPLRDENFSRIRDASPAWATLNGTRTVVDSHGRDSSVFSPLRGAASVSAATAGSGPAAKASVSLFSPLRLDFSVDGGDAGTGRIEHSTLPSRPDLSARADGAFDRLDSEPAGAADPQPAASRGRARPDGAGGGDGSSAALLAEPDSPPEAEARRDVLAELAFGGVSAVGAERGKQAGDEAPLPHTLVEKLDGLQEKMDEMYLGMRRENFNTQWSFGKHIYEVKSSMNDMAAVIRSLQAEVVRLREDNQYLGCKF